VGRMLRERRWTVAVAEACTGGLLGHRLTRVAGASAYFERGVLAYSNRAKTELLGVPESILSAHGAVSGPCAEAMARGVAILAGASCAVAVTGIAGPDGGTAAKPVGTVFVGLVVGEQALARRFSFAGDRSAVTWQSTQAALDMLRRSLRARS
jgi:nicotinamide-nucleotide amidase